MNVSSEPDTDLAAIRGRATWNAANFGLTPALQAGRDTLSVLLLLDAEREEVERLRAMVAKQAVESVSADIIVRRLAACWDRRGDMGAVARDAKRYIGEDPDENRA